jgi:hypothetical protein
MSLLMDNPSDDGGRPAPGGANSARTVIREMRGPVEERVTVLRSTLSRATPQHRSSQVGEASPVLSTCRYLFPSSLLIRRQPTTGAHNPGINSHHASRRRGVNRPYRDGPTSRLVIRHRLAPGVGKMTASYDTIRETRPSVAVPPELAAHMCDTSSPGSAQPRGTTGSGQRIVCNGDPRTRSQDDLQDRSRSPIRELSTRRV